MNVPFDLHTMFVVCSSLTVVSGLCMVLVQLTGQLYPGFRYFTVGVIGQGLAFTSFAYSQNLPFLIGSVGGNIFYILYPVFYSRGFRSFAGIKAPLLPAVLGIAYICVSTYYFSSVHLSLILRVASGQVVIIPFFIDSALVIWRAPAFRYLVVRPWLAGAFVLMVVVGLTRVALMFDFEPDRVQIWAPSTIQVIYMTLLTALSFCVVIGVIVLNFQRAVKDLSDKESLLSADVIARKKIEMALRETESRYRTLIEGLPISMTVHRDGLVIYANPSAIKMFRANSLNDLIGKRMLDLISSEFHQAVQMRRKNIRERGIGGPLAEMRYVRLDGTSFEVETMSAPIFYDGAMATQVTAHDISELKRAEVERHVLERKLQETQKLESLGVLAGGIAHDFNNILTGILGNASLAILELPPGSPAEENIRAVTHGSQRAADLCRQLLAYSGKGNFVVRNLSLNHLVRDTAHLLKISIGKNVELRFSLHPNLPAIEADGTQIRQVIMNLVINASEAIGEESGLIELSTGLEKIEADLPTGDETIVSQEPLSGTYVYLAVADTGCGMSSETRAKIFDPFFTTKFTGRGLGLAAVLGIMRGHNGALKLASHPGKGTTFKLLFPCAEGEADTEGVTHYAGASWRGHGVVLVVDDEDSVRHTAGQMLRKMGFEVVLARDGREAVELFQAEPKRFRLVLMDLTMPRLDGKRAFAELRLIRGDVAIVLMSGYDEKDAASTFANEEFTNFIQKPFQVGDLSKVVQAVLARGEGPKPA